MKTIRIHGNDVIITDETIQATRKHFIGNAIDCINGAKSGEFSVNNLDKYISWENERIERFKSGEGDNSLTFWQRAYWIQSGECVGILS